jgi:hypothetical protein
MPAFCVLRSRQVLAETAFSDIFTLTTTTEALSEDERYAFRIDDPEEDEVYKICIGDFEPDEPEGKELGPQVWWTPWVYFESARGRVTIHLFSRSLRAGGAWKKRMDLAVIVIPSKLGDARYNAMYESLRAVSAGLVFDLLSKSRVSVGLKTEDNLSVRPASSELMMLSQLWSRLSLAIAEIASQPSGVLQRTKAVQAHLRSTRISRRDLNSLVKRGIDLRSPRSLGSVRVVRHVIEESIDTSEHRTILAILQLLYARVEDCERRANAQVAYMVSERPLRDFEIQGHNPFMETDIPKIERLRAIITEAALLREQIRSAMSLSLFKGLQPELAALVSPVFNHVPSYRRLRDEAIRYFRSTVALLDTGIEERSKATQRIYEQWVFLQLVASMRFVGLQPVSQESLLSRSQQNRFTIDFDRGTRVEFIAHDGRAILVRYEPWVHPKATATQAGETLYRGIVGDVAWSPDVLIEVFAGSASGSQAQYALVVDAKYSRVVKESQRQGVSKYNNIRGIVDDRPVVKQVWIAHPATEGITPWDDAVVWTSDGPNRPYDEIINGSIGALPPEQGTEVILGELNEKVVEFVRSICRYLRLTSRSEAASS